jgi:hypothetical protein
MLTGVGAVAIALIPAARVAELESRKTSRDPAALYAPAFNRSAPYLKL